MKPLAMIMLEGFSETYLSREITPFTYELASQGSHVKLDPMFAFRGIEATIFTGLYPNQHGIWTEFCLSDSVIKQYKKDTATHFNTKSNILNFFNPFFNDKLQRAIRYGLQRFLKQDNIQMANLIPVGAINLFEASLMASIYTENVLDSIPTLFDKLRAAGQAFTYIEPPLVGGYDILKSLEQAIKKFPNNLFWYVKLCEHDSVGHKFGPHSEEMKKCSIRLDAVVDKITEKLRSNFHDFSLIIMSAHGMSTVKGTVNLQERLKRVTVKPYRDYLIFLDSTMARFWFSNENAENKIRNTLQNVNHGHILTDPEIETLNVPNDLRYGELIFVLDEGYIIHPSYFHASQLPKGMHGFAYGLSPDNYSPLIMYGSNMPHLSEKLQYSDVFTLLSGILDLDGDAHESCAIRQE